MNGAASSSLNPSRVQGAYPDGWHLPSDAEWRQLVKFLGMSQSEADDAGLRGTNEGGKLKERGTSHWYSLNTGATNSSGFTAPPGGNLYSDGLFLDAGKFAYFWKATEGGASLAWYRTLYYGWEDVYRYSATRRTEIRSVVLGIETGGICGWN